MDSFYIVQVREWQWKRRRLMKRKQYFQIFSISSLLNLWAWNLWIERANCTVVFGDNYVFQKSWFESLGVTSKTIWSPQSPVWSGLSPASCQPQSVPVWKLILPQTLISLCDVQEKGLGTGKIQVWMLVSLISGLWMLSNLTSFNL